MPHIPWSLFYRWMRPTGGKAYLGAALDREISAASGNFGEVFFNLMIGLNNHIALNGLSGEPVFAGGAPTFIRTSVLPMALLFPPPLVRIRAEEALLRSLFGG